MDADRFGSRTTWLPTVLALLAFAGNSLLCRAALGRTGIDPASFTAIRLASGAVGTWAIIACRRAGSPPAPHAGSWLSALALFVYAAGFSFAYQALPAGLGALLLFLAVQVTMIGWGLARGERLTGIQGVGLGLALGGLGWLLHPAGAAFALSPALLMLGAGVAWGVYSLRGRQNLDPGAATAGNFLRAVPMALLLALAVAGAGGRLRLTAAGLGYGVLSGAVASGLGYALWYQAVRRLRASSAALVQLGVPVLTALAGTVLLGEPLTVRTGLASLAILGGIAAQGLPYRGRGAKIK